MKRLHSQRGDTIVEVLISIAVIGLVLAGAYSTSNRSLTDVRDAQEHEQAIALAETQLEIMDSKTTAQLNSAPSDFCFDTSTPDQAITNYSAPDSPCQGQQAEEYNVDVKKRGSPIDDGLQTYEVDITWPSLNGNEDQVQLFYQPGTNS